MYNDRVVIPATSTLIPKLLFKFHDSAAGGHNGEFKTYLRIAVHWYWVGMRKRVAQYVRACSVCQTQKASHQQPQGLLQPLTMPAHVWDEVSMDFVEALPKSGGFDTILVVVEKLSKYAHFVRLRHPFTAKSVAAFFIKDIVRLHGFPTSIISDRDKVFMSIFLHELFRLQGTSLLHSSAYHLQTDGQTEIVNQALETYLRYFINGQPKEWTKWLY